MWLWVVNGLLSAFALLVGGAVLLYEGRVSGPVIVLAFVLAMSTVTFWFAMSAYRVGGGRNLIRIYADRIEMPHVGAEVAHGAVALLDVHHGDLAELSAVRRLPAPFRIENRVVQLRVVPPVLLPHRQHPRFQPAPIRFAFVGVDQRRVSRGESILGGASAPKAEPRHRGTLPTPA